MTFDALSFVLGALAVTIVVVAWLWWAGRECRHRYWSWVNCTLLLRDEWRGRPSRTGFGGATQFMVEHDMCAKCGTRRLPKEAFAMPAPLLTPTTTRSTLGSAD